MHILVRAPSPAFRGALSEHPERGLIDPERAARQHAAFVAELRRAGLSVVELPAAPELADAPFVSDTMLALPHAEDPDGPAALLVLTRPGAASRRPEVASVAAAMTDLLPSVEPTQIEEPGTLDAGDVVVYGRRVAIGVSGRTNICGAGQLALAVQLAGYRPILCPVTDRLHLATAVTAVGPSRLVGTRAGFASLDRASREAAPANEIERILVPDEELPAANVLAVGGRCFVASGYPRTAAALRAAGEVVVEVALDEFARADGGPTCLVGIVP